MIQPPAHTCPSFSAFLTPVNDLRPPSCPGRTCKTSLLITLILEPLHSFCQKVWPTIPPKWTPNQTPSLSSLCQPCPSHQLPALMHCRGLPVSAPIVLLLQSSRRGQIHYHQNLIMPLPLLKDLQCLPNTLRKNSNSSLWLTGHMSGQAIVAHSVAPAMLPFTQHQGLSTGQSIPLPRMLFSSCITPSQFKCH